MSDRSWKWFKHGWQFDVTFNAIWPRGERGFGKLTVFAETKDKQDARREAIAEIAKYGYTNIEITKVIERFAR